MLSVRKGVAVRGILFWFRLNVSLFSVPWWIVESKRWKLSGHGGHMFVGD
jgi:hypothetical protein